MAGAPQISPPSGSQCPAPHLCVGWLLAASGPHLHFAGEGSGAVSISATNFVSLAAGFARGEGNERANEGNIRGAGLASVGQLIEGCELGRSMKKRPWQPLFTRRGLLLRCLSPARLREH